MPDRTPQNPIASPSPAQPLYNLGKALAKQKKWSEAIDAYRQALAILPHYKIYLALGVALENSDRITEAIECYGQVLQLQPNLTEARQKLENLQSSTRHTRSHWEIAASHTPRLKKPKPISSVENGTRRFPSANEPYKSNPHLPIFTRYWAMPSTENENSKRPNMPI